MKDLTGNMDARDWAKEFVRMVDEKPAIARDEATMLAWFAGAIMTGYDTAVRRTIEDNLRAED